MYGRAILVLVLAAVAVQSSSDVEEQVIHTKDTDTKPIHHLKEVIEESVKAEKKALEKLHKELSGKIREATKYVRTKFHKQIHLSYDKIKKLEEEAHKNKVDIQACLKDKHELKHLPKEFYKKVTACNRDISIKNRELVVREKKVVEESHHIIKKLSAEFKACDKIAENLKCKAKVNAEITRALHQEPAKLKKTVDEGAPAISRLVPSAEKCATKEAHELMAKEAKIARQIESCITNKIHSHVKA